ncbi:hypothetical protein AMK33_18370 [Streptomyces sp. CB02400]|nr:hypothetical protein AMK33_18370 [Streptomyces sp. CB02400]
MLLVTLPVERLVPVACLHDAGESAPQAVEDIPCLLLYGGLPQLVVLILRHREFHAVRHDGY